jgi:DNA-3-methyladenine glycosylase I
MLTDYKSIFENVEAALIRVGAQNIPEEIIRSKLNAFKAVETKQFTDNDYFRVLIYIPFYSGFRAETVNNSMGTILRYFSNYKAVAKYDHTMVKKILNDPQMIRHSGKVNASIGNARTFGNIIDQYGSFQTFVDSFSPKASFENLMRLRQELRKLFRYIGQITSYHFLTDIGMPVLKPDRVIRRIFYRLGLIESEEETEELLLQAVAEGNKFVQVTGLPIRYIDIVFVAYGQVKSEEFGIERGICLKDNPSCNLCDVSGYCRYFTGELPVPAP